MGKRKPKKRKNKLARPPKKSGGLKRAGLGGIQWERPVRPPDFGMDFDEGEETLPGAGKFDAPCVPHYLPASERPFGAVDPSMYGSTRYRKFRDEVIAIRGTLPESKEAFAVYDVVDSKQRQWLTRYCLKKEGGKLPGWQQYILERAGFNWVRGKAPAAKPKPKPKPRPKAKAPPKKVSRKKAPRKTETKARKKAKVAAPRENPREVAWAKAYQALYEQCAGASDPDLALVALLRGKDEHFVWLRKQITALRMGKLKPERLEKLRALPFDFNIIMAYRPFTQWRNSYNAYAEGKSDHGVRWAVMQRRAKALGELPRWREVALDAINFDWSLPEGMLVTAGPLSEKEKIERIEARWRSKLETYLALEAEYGKPLSKDLVEKHGLRPFISRLREGYKKGKLRPELIADFKAKGFEFSGAAARRQMLNRNWNRQFEKLKRFKERFGNVLVPSSYEDDPELGLWLARQRERLTQGKLKGEKLEKLRAIGVERSRRDGQRTRAKVHMSAWLKVFRQIEAVLQAEYGGKMPAVGRFSEKHRTWMKRQRKKIESGELETWQLEKLDAVGFDPQNLPKPPPQVDWDERMERLRRFVREHGHARVARSNPDRKLYSFVQIVRSRYRNGELTSGQLRELKEQNFSFDPYGEVSPAWMRHYEALKEYHRIHGHCNLPRAYPESQALSEFVAQARQRGRKGRLLAEHIRLLDALDFEWSGGHPVAKDE